MLYCGNWFASLFFVASSTSMLGQLASQHIRKRLKIVFRLGIIATILFFVLLFSLSLSTGIDTLYAQLVVLAMGFVMVIGYVSLSRNSEKEPRSPLIFFFLLNILSSTLIWATGILNSPFIILYVILIIVTSQLYNYKQALAQTCVALIGFIAVYGATTNLIIPYYSLLPDTDISLLYQPTIVIFVYGLLYTILLFFTAFSSSSARTVLFRSQQSAIDTTYQEKIIQDMPIGVLIIDHDLSILGNNPAAAILFPFAGAPSPLIKYLSLGKIRPYQTLHRLAKSGETKKLTWNVDTGEVIPVTISVRLLPGAKSKDESFIVFLQQ